MTEVPIAVQIIVETAIGVSLLFFLWFVISVIREAARRIRVTKWAARHPDLVKKESR